MSHLPLSFMNRLNKTESAVFIFWVLYFYETPYQIMYESQLPSLCRVAALKSLPAHRFSVFWSFGSVGFITFLRAE